MRVRTALAFALLSGACAAPSVTVRSPVPTVEGLALPSGPGSVTPFLHAGPEGILRASWLEALEGDSHALRVASHDGMAWSPPVTVTSGSRLLANWADTPTLRDLGGNRLAISWPVMREGGNFAYDLALAFSDDGGASWSDAVTPHSDDTDTEHGFPAFGAAGDAGVALAWLDGRDYAVNDPASMSLRFARVSASGDVTDERVLDGRTCDCCPIAAATGSEGLMIVYRDRSDGGEIRDIALVRESAEGWSEPTLVHSDDWEIAGCPVNGPALAAEGKRVAVAWFTAAGDEPKAWAAFSSDGGRSFGDAIRVDEGEPTGRVDLVLLGDSSAAVAWVEGEQLRLRLLDEGGTSGPAHVLATLPAGRPAGMPRLVHWGDELAAAWTAPGEPGRVEVARVSLPTR